MLFIIWITQYTLFTSSICIFQSVFLKWCFFHLLRVNIFTTSINWWYCIHHPFYLKKKKWFSAESLENISNIPVCISQTRQLKAAISACFIVTVCTCRRETLVTLEMPLNGREIQTERGRGATGERGTCWADGSSVIPTWGPTGTNWNAVGHGAQSVFICGLVCQEGLFSVLLFVLSRNWRGI